KIRGVRLRHDFDWSDVTVVVAGDLPVNHVALIVHDQPILARDVVKHAYEPIALVACRDRAKLVRAVAAVEVDVEPLPAIFDPFEALAKGDVQKRYLITKGAADGGARESEAAIDAAIARCDVVVTGR